MDAEQNGMLAAGPFFQVLLQWSVFLGDGVDS